MTIPAVAIPALAGVIAALFVGAHPASQRARAAALATAWIAVAWLLAASGLLAKADARPLGPFMVAIVAGSILYARRSVLVELPLAALIGFQAFRLPLELVLHEAGRTGLAPTALTFSGLNFDIVTGVTAVIVAPLASRGAWGHRLAFAWNVLGTGLLAVIGAIAIATAPFVLALGDDQVNGWVTRVPYVLLPAVLVAAALIGHVLVFRKLAAQAPPRTASSSIEHRRAHR